MAASRVAKLLAAMSAAWSPFFAAGESGAIHDAVVGDDECAAGEDCALNALQLRARSAADPASGDGEPLIAEALPAWDDPSKLGGPAADPSEELGASTEVGYHHHHHSGGHGGAYCESHIEEERCGLYKHCRGMPYCVFGNYMVVPGKPCPGMESINGGNAHSYDYLFGVARAFCGYRGCVLMTNPVGHRTQDQLHIHFRHMIKSGPQMQASLEDATCNNDGWVHFNPHCCGCGHSKARAFSGRPGVFSEVAKAFGGGSLASVGISVWFGCGKTIILATTHCSIEHSVSVR
mmetsp:Transcript_54776/g.158486  ORF Transcript_54776/g.158486 Transcript_54776/m.158486 type:complete len:291 (+) Transcript_54776:63-935(+)